MGLILAAGCMAGGSTKVYKDSEPAEICRRPDLMAWGPPADVNVKAG